MYKPIQNYISALADESWQPSVDRQVPLTAIVKVISDLLDQQGRVEINIICTHNSRRSHLAQIWLLALADFLQINHIETFSGGTEATSFHPNSVSALKRVGFIIDAKFDEQNPEHEVKWADNRSTTAFSKIYDHSSNPKTNFLAILVCNDADRACPIVRGAASKVILPFEDPKRYDGSPMQDAAYDTACHRIAQEMFWVLSQVKQR